MGLYGGHFLKIYPKPYSIYLRRTTGFGALGLAFRVHGFGLGLKAYGFGFMVGI